MKLRRVIFIALTLVILLAGLAFIFRSPFNQWRTPTSSQEVDDYLLDQQRTLASLQKVADYPLFVMTYYGGYGFQDFLQHGLRAEARPGSELSQAWACTVFSALSEEGDLVLGRNFDWYNHAALLLYTDPSDGYASVSLVDASYLGYSLKDDTWPDQQQLLQAPYWPFDGMNEAGLAVGMMAVPRAEASQASEKVTISSLQAIRLLLDYAQDVNEAILLLQAYNIEFSGGPPVHYLITDAARNSAVIEFVDGEMIVLRSDDPWQVSTNFVISQEQPDGAGSSCWRYNRAYETLAEAKGMISAPDAVTLLGNVSQDSTMWSVVYGMKTGDIQIALDRNYDEIKEFKLQMAGD
jgi:hypothetical protein